MNSKNTRGPRGACRGEIDLEADDVDDGEGGLPAIHKIETRPLDLSEPLLSPKEVSTLVGRSLSALAKDRMTKTGLPYRKVCGRIRYAPADIRAYLDARRVVTDA